MPDLTIPGPAVPIASAKCPNCAAMSSASINEIWYQKFTIWLKNTNAGTADITAIEADIAAIKAFVGMP